MERNTNKYDKYIIMCAISIIVVTFTLLFSTMNASAETTFTLTDYKNQAKTYANENNYLYWAIYTRYNTSKLADEYFAIYSNNRIYANFNVFVGDSHFVIGTINGNTWQHASENSEGIGHADWERSGGYHISEYYGAELINVVASSHDVLKYADYVGNNIGVAGEGVFFSLPKPTPILPNQVQPQQLTQATSQVVGILPILLGCLVGFLGLRKGLAILQGILHQA